MTTNGERIQRAVAELDPQVVLIDYFDTLVTRTIHRRQVKVVAARHLADRWDLGPPERLLAARRTAEDVVARRWRDAGLDPEHRIEETMAEVWAQLPAITGGTQPMRCEDLVATAVEIELAVERLAQVVDQDVVAAIEAARRPVVLVSDFYLGPELFARMLAGHGLTGLVRQLVVSCDGRLSKASGRLYAEVLASLQRDGLAAGPDRVLMIGDHPVSDGENARRHGIATVLIERPPETRRPGLSGRRPAPIARRRATTAALYRHGEEPFVELAATLYLFTSRLHAEARRRRLDPLLFLAREGRFMRTLFQRYQEISPAAAGCPIPHHYLVVSRRSTVLPGMKSLDQETFGQILDRYPRISMRRLVRSIGLDDGLAVQVAADLGVSPEGPAPLDGLRGHAGFRDAYERARAEQSALLRRYVAEVTGTEDGPLHLVDVGWKGTMQDHLRLALGSGRQISGWYLGIVASAPLVQGEHKHGLVFDSRSPRTPAFRTLRHFKTLYELLLQAGHGSAAGYRLSADGSRVEPLLDEQADEAESFARYLAPLQDGVLAAFEELCRADGLAASPLLPGPEEAADQHARMLYYPRRREIALVGALRHYENFGLMELVSVERPRARGAALWRGRLRAAGNPRRLLGSGWPPLELRALGLDRLVPVLGAYRQIRERTIPNIRRMVRERGA